MILIGREEEIQNNVFQIPNKSRTTRRNPRRASNTSKQGRRDESGQHPAGKSLRKEEVHPFGRRKLEFPKMQISENQGILVGGGRVAEHEGRSRGRCCQRAEGAGGVWAMAKK